MNKKLTNQEIEHIFQNIMEYYQKYLKEKGVSIPALKDKNGYTKNALVLVRLALKYPNTDIVSKEELTEFIRLYYPNTSDVQQARHLGAQSGWFIISGTRGEISTENIPKGSYKLYSLTETHPSFVPDRRTGIETEDFEQIKKEYDYRCAVCGCEEGKPHRFRRNTLVILQEGHIDPTRDLIAGNIIPQCQICNRPDRNRWVYDKTGRVIEVAHTHDGLRIVKRFLESSSSDVKKYIYQWLSTMLNLK